MVEKIIINPDKVRGYGNIVSSKGANDFITYASSVTEGTDTVYGATEKVYSLEDTFVKVDGGTISNHNDIWTLRSVESTSLVRGDTYSTVSEIDSNEAYVETSFSGNVTIEFDVNINGDVTRFFAQFAKSGGTNTGFSLYNSLSTATINTWYHCKFVINGDSITFKVMEEGATESTKTLESPIKFRLRTLSEITAISFKNFVIYG